MRWVKRIGVFLAAAIGIAIAAALAFYLYLRQSVPTYSGEARLTGLSAPVEIVRDKHAIPHIFASSWNDAYFALGYAQAQDRLWQMEMNRRIASGRIAEVVGERALDERHGLSLRRRLRLEPHRLHARRRHDDGELDVHPSIR